MAENTQNSKAPEAGAPKSVAPEQSLAAATPPRRSALSGLSLLVAALALALAAWNWWQAWQLTDGDGSGSDAPAWQQAVANLQTSLQSDRSQNDQRNAAIATRVDELSASLEAANTGAGERLAAARSLIGDLDQSVAGLEGRQASLERLASEQNSREQGGDQRMRLAEAAWLMSLAEERLALFGDTQMAATALGLADDQLRYLDDPRLAGVRRTLAGEIAALKSYYQPDVAQLAGRIGVLEDAVDEWPLRRELAPPENEPIADTVSDSGSDGDGFFAGVGEVLGKLVVVRREDRIDTPVLAPDEVRWLQENTRRELALARYAAQAREFEAASMALERVAAWGQRYFDQTSEVMITAMDELQAIAGRLAQQPVPQLGARAELESLLSIQRE